MKIYGIFLVSGLAVGSLYALGGIGLVILRRATGVLNFAYGAIGAASAMLCWQMLDWGLPGPLAWFGAILPAIAAAVCGRLDSLPLTFAGGLVIGIVEAMLALVDPLAPLRSMAPFVIAALAIVWMQRGRKLTFLDDG